MDLELSPEEKSWIEESFIRASATQRAIAALERAVTQHRSQIEQQLGEARGVFRTVLRHRSLNPDAYEAAWDDAAQELRISPIAGAEVSEAPIVRVVEDPASPS